MNIDEIVETYTSLRDAKQEMEARHKEELAPIQDAMQRVEAALLILFENLGTDSVKTPHGTAYKSIVASVKVTDWSDTLRRILAEEAFDLLEARVNKTAWTEGGRQWPGVEMTKAVKVNVRRAT